MGIKDPKVSNLPRYPYPKHTDSLADCVAVEPERFFATLYKELHRIARNTLRRNITITLSPTTLLHEAFLNVSQREELTFSHTGHFIGYAARVMRGLVVNHLRTRSTKKRGGDAEITSLTTGLLDCGQADLDVEQLNDALDALVKTDPRLAECVELRFFCGLSLSEIAAMHAVSERTVERDWAKARVLLNRFMTMDCG